MNIERKTELYKNVREAGDGNRRRLCIRSMKEFHPVTAKFYEEQKELYDELKNLMWKVFHCEDIETEDVAKYVDEMADSIITLEQMTGNHDMLNQITERVNFKLKRLGERLVTGDL